MNLRLFQDVVMRADAPEEAIILMKFEGKSIEHINACLPAVFVPFHLLDPEGGMPDVMNKKLNLFIKFLLNGDGKSFIILLEDSGAEDFHFLRSAIKSSTLSKDFVFPLAISLSASASAFGQSKSLKYGGRVRAYLINSATASSVLVFRADFLYFSISSMISSASVIVISRCAMVSLPLQQHTTPQGLKSICAHGALNSVRRVFCPRFCFGIS